MMNDAIDRGRGKSIVLFEEFSPIAKGSIGGDDDGVTIPAVGYDLKDFASCAKFSDISKLQLSDLDPLEEKLNLPTPVTKLCHNQRWRNEVVSNFMLAFLFCSGLKYSLSPMEIFLNSKILQAIFNLCKGNPFRTGLDYPQGHLFFSHI